MSISQINQTLSRLYNRRFALNKLTTGVICALALSGFSPSYAIADEPVSFWTEFVPSTDTRLIFVSESQGNDSNSGLNPSSPVKTIAKGYTLLRDGYPDWMLLKRGDTWNESVPNWGKSGRSVSETMVLGAYGDDTARPQIRPDGGRSGMTMHGNDEIAFLAFVGLHIEPQSRTDDQNGTGIGMLKSSHDILFEDMYVAGFAVNFVLQEFSGSIISNIRINGCVVVDAWSNAGHAEGLFAKGVDGLTIGNSVFDHNGFSEEHHAEPAVFNHNLYIQNGNVNVIFRNNISADASSHGLQLRCGGIIEDNLFISNPLSILLGGGNHPEEGGVTGSVQRNLVMYGRGITPSMPRSIGIETNNIRNAIIADNFLYKGEIGYNGSAISLSGPSHIGPGSYGTTNLLISRNTIIDWNGSVDLKTPPNGQAYHNVSFIDNTIFRDMNANNGNSNYNKPLISAPNIGETDLRVSGNSYNLIGMHNRPFIEGGVNMSVDEWKSEMEHDLTYNLIDSLPNALGLDSYMSSIGLEGGMEEFITRSRLLSRQTLDPRMSSTAVYQWFKSQLH